MARILLTSGPTRQYLDPVRYLTNASSGWMGACLAQAAIEAGHEVTIVSGPVSVEYPAAATIIPVVSTEEMLAAARAAFTDCDGLIAVAAPCDYRPIAVSPHKISKTGDPLVLHLIETPDIAATLGAEKGQRWVVGFALESQDHRFRAITKLTKKCCDLIVLNEPTAMDALDNNVEVLDPTGKVILQVSGDKSAVAKHLIRLIGERLI